MKTLASPPMVAPTYSVDNGRACADKFAVSEARIEFCSNFVGQDFEKDFYSNGKRYHGFPHF